MHLVIFCSCIESVEASNIKYHLHFVCSDTLCEIYIYIYSNVEEVESTSIKCNLHFVAPHFTKTNCHCSPPHPPPYCQIISTVVEDAAIAQPIITFNPLPVQNGIWELHGVNTGSNQIQPVTITNCFLKRMLVGTLDGIDPTTKCWCSSLFCIAYELFSESNQVLCIL